MSSIFSNLNIYNLEHSFNIYYFIELLLLSAYFIPLTKSIVCATLINVYNVNIPDYYVDTSYYKS